MNNKKHLAFVAHFHTEEEERWVFVDYSNKLVEDSAIYSVEELSSKLSEYDLTLLEVDKRPHASYYIFEIN